MLSARASYSEYQDKRAQLFSDFAARFSLPENLDTSSISGFYRALKRKTIDLKLPSVTNLDNQKLEYFDITLYSRYQRQGHIIIDSELYGLVYKQSEKLNGSSQGFFTSNCQAANFALLQALNLCYPQAKLFYPSDRLYFESDYIINRFSNLFKKPNDKQTIVYLDSAFLLNQEELLCFEQMGDECIAVIFDTTCFDRQGELVSKVVQSCQRLSIPLILTRSHLKLDSLGTEYESLGSIFFLNSKDEELYKKCHEYVSHMGAFAFINQIYPFLFDQKLKDLNSWRIERIRDNSNEIFPCINSYKGEMGEYHKERLHRLNHVFVYQREKIDFLKAGERFMALCNVYNVSGKFCDSFGFDFFSLTNVESCDQMNRGFLRFCSPVDSLENKGAVEVINNLIKHLAIK